MRILSLFVALTFSATVSLLAQDTTQKDNLPELHKIKTVTLGPSYSCRPADEFKRGYEKTALYLTNDSIFGSGPDLLFNGACGSEDYFDASFSGDDMSLIADLGSHVSLEEISASRAFNVNRIHAEAEYSKFVKATKVERHHIYAVLLNEGDKRGLFVFKVIDHVPNKSVELKYAVKAYQIMPRGKSSPGFDWEQESR